MLINICFGFIMFIASLIESPFLDTRMWQKRKTQLANKELTSIGDTPLFVCRVSPHAKCSAPSVRTLDSGSTNAVSLSPHTQWHHFVFTMPVAPALQNQTHRELMYRPLQFQKRSQYFFSTHDKPLPVAMCVHNPNRSPFKIQS